MDDASEAVASGGSGLGAVVALGAGALNSAQIGAKPGTTSSSKDVPSLLGIRVGDTRAALERRGRIEKCSDEGANSGCTLTIRNTDAIPGTPASVGLEDGKVVHVELRYSDRTFGPPMDPKTNWRVQRIWHGVEEAIASRYGVADIVESSPGGLGDDTWITQSIWLLGPQSLVVQRSHRPAIDQNGEALGFPLMMGHYTPLTIQLWKGDPPMLSKKALAERREKRTSELTRLFELVTAY